MMKASTLRKVRRMPVVDRLRLVRAILDTIADDELQLGLTRREKSALGKRIAARRKSRAAGASRKRAKRAPKA